MGINLVLVSRRKDALDALGDRLKAEHGVDYRSVSQDLTATDAGASLLAATADLDIGLYISNAGADGAGNSFLDTETERSHRLVRMNIGTSRKLVELALTNLASALKNTGTSMA